MDLFPYFRDVLHGPWKKIGHGIDYKLNTINHILYFQGSSDASDWKYNFDFPVRAYRSSDVDWKVHGGFLAAWKTVKNIILPLMIQYDDLTIVGYSHGGALACLAHEDYLYHTKKQPNTIVFGSPRILWCQNAKKIIPRFSNVLNVQNMWDIVTKLPPKWMGFVDVGVITHVGSKYWISGHSKELYLGSLYGK